MKNRFTVQFRGNVDYANQEELQTKIREVLKSFPQFKVTFQSVEVWSDFQGNPRLFNDDGSDYVVPPVVKSAEEVKQVQEEAPAVKEEPKQE